MLSLGVRKSLSRHSYKFQRGTTEVLKTSIRDLVDIKETVNIHTPEAMDIS